MLGHASAEQNPPDPAIFEFAFEESLSDFHARKDCTVRAIYSIQLPEDRGCIDEIIQNAYGQHSGITLIEFGYCNISTIVSSSFVCAGISESTNAFEILPTPFDLVARCYDPGAFDGVLITPIDTEAFASSF